MGTEKYLKLGLLNVRSLNTGRAELLESMQKYEPDILALNETWLRCGENTDAFHIPGYTFKHVPRTTGKRGGGVGFYIRKGIKVRVIQQPQTELEQLWIEVRIKGSHIAVGTAYRPEYQFVNKSIEELSETLSALSAYSFQCLLMDFNVNLKDKDSKNAQEFLSFLEQQNYSQLVQEPTRVTETTSSLIDLIITDAPTRCKNVKVIHNTCLSDHALVTAEFNIKKPKVQAQYVRRRCLNKINVELFEKDLNAIPWDDIMCLDDVNAMVEQFNNHILELFDKHAPVVCIKTKEKPHPWITDVIKIMMNLRDDALKKAHKYNEESNWSYYRNLRNYTNASIKREQTAYFTFYVNNNLKKPNKMWYHFKKISPFGHKTPSHIPEHLKIPNRINDHF